MSKKEWGNATWLLFHTIAEKIKDDKFKESKNIIIDIIFGIATHLPCPDCSKHAIMELKAVNLNLINDKEHLQEFIRQFHNRVNIRLNVKQFSQTEVKDMYKNINTNTVINNFLKIYKNQAYNQKLLLASFYRGKYFSKLIKLLSDLRPNLED